MSGVQVVSAATDVVRDGHYEWIDGVPVRTLLLEGVRVNSCLRSQELDHATWTKGDASVTANAATAPDGTLTADFLAETTANAAHFVAQGVTITAGGVTQSLSVHVKASTRSRVALYLTGGVSVMGLMADLSAGTVTAYAAGSGNVHRVRLVEQTNGWSRLEVSGVLDAATTSATLVVALVDGAGAISYTGTSGLGLYVWGAQAEVDQACVSSYIPTTSATVTRSADVYAIAYPYTPLASTFYVKFVDLGTCSINGARIFSVSDAANASPQLICYSTGPGQIEFDHYNASTGVGAIVAAAVVPGDVVEVRAVLYANGATLLGVSINGAAEVVSSTSAALAPAAAWSGTTLYLNSAGASASPGFAAFIDLKTSRGDRSLTDMRSL